MEALPPDIGSDLALLFTKLRVYYGCMEIIYALLEVDIVKEFIRFFLERCVSRGNHP
jgi:hypothetical protein